HCPALSSLFFSLLLPPPPSSTLFPYTTLFRSISVYAANLENLALFLGIDAAKIRGTGTSTDPYQLIASGITLASHGLMAFRAKGDRKSTRLNSSHVAISYAVFCLKKKKKRKNE